MSKSSYVMAEDPAHDLAIVRAMNEELEEYIVEDELYRTITVSLPSGDQMLQMTGADLLTRLYRLQGERSQLSAEEQSIFDTVKESVERTIYSLRTRFHKRLEREIKARLDSLKWFLDDCAADSQRCYVEFPFEMRNRQRIEEAIKELDGPLPDELRKQLRQIDDRIRLVAVSSEFLWDERLKSIFPADPYWYLYQRPANRR